LQFSVSKKRNSKIILNHLYFNCQICARPEQNGNSRLKINPVKNNFTNDEKKAKGSNITGDTSKQQTLKGGP
jgi:hypothetical protein